MKKILILNDIHAGTTRPSTTHEGVYRQANNEALVTLEKYLPKFNKQDYDLAINLGDTIRHLNIHDQDYKLYEQAMQLFAKIDADKLYIAGNHEIETLSRHDIDTVATLNDINSQKTGVIDLGIAQIVWADCEMDSENMAELPSAALLWLKEHVDFSKRTIFFSHYSVAPLDSSQSFYFDSDGAKFMSYKNGEEVQRLLEKRTTNTAINAHTHMSTYKMINGVNYISALAFTENITASQYPDANPGIYSELLIEEEKMTFKSYSGDFCFLSFEL